MVKSIPRRVLLKVSGEMLGGNSLFGMDRAVLLRICEDIATVVQSGIQVCLVVGGGNIFRGVRGTSNELKRSNADKMGMLATVINALALQDALESMNIAARAMSGTAMPSVCESFSHGRAMHHLERGRVPVFGGGVGSPFFTTDTTAVLRSVEMECDALFKGTQVDGIYSDDPVVNPDAIHHNRLTYEHVLAQNLTVMDATAIAMARANSMPVYVFSLQTAGAFAAVLRSEGKFTEVGN